MLLNVEQKHDNNLNSNILERDIPVVKKKKNLMSNKNQ